MLPFYYFHVKCIRKYLQEDRERERENRMSMMPTAVVLEYWNYSGPTFIEFRVGENVKKSLFTHTVMPCSCSFNSLPVVGKHTCLHSTKLQDSYAYTIHACPEPLYPLILTAAAAAVTSIQSSRCIALLHKKQSFNEV